MKIGIVDIDTSHPRNWIPFERNLGHEIAGLWDGGSVHSPQYVQTFAQEHNIPRVYDSPKDLAGDVDAVIIHGCNWDTHVDKARPFVEAGKGVLLDKPLAGNLRDLNQLRQWADSGARITGGSSLRFCGEARDWIAQPLEQRGTPRVIFAGCGVDEYNYGIHAYSTLFALTSARPVTARWLANEPQNQIEITLDDATRAIVTVGGEGWTPSYATIVTDNGVHHLNIATTPDPLYKTFLSAVLPYLAGETDQPPIPMEQLILSELAALAALESRRQNGQVVHVDSLTEDTPGYDGAAFAEGYKKQYGK